MTRKYNVILYDGELILTNYFTNELKFETSRVDIFYKLIDKRLIIVFELMMIDQDPVKCKILNYISCVDFDSMTPENPDDLLTFVKICKFEMIDDFKIKINDAVNYDFSEFELKELGPNITYVDELNYIDPSDYLSILNKAKFRNVQIETM